ncbi:hypothetical protein [Streptomyces misionensis]|uniref:hypothetical protein n=1 Tax=Streptomyces misionensis TaxID=67331 RepID=UPI0033B922A9
MAGSRLFTVHLRGRPDTPGPRPARRRPALTRLLASGAIAPALGAAPVAVSPAAHAATPAGHAAAVPASAPGRTAPGAASTDTAAANASCTAGNLPDRAIGPAVRRPPGRRHRRTR